MELFPIHHNPPWIDKNQLSFTRIPDIPDALFAIINANLDKISSPHPVVSIVIPAWNEEINIVRTIYTLSMNRPSVPVEIIVVNNNSTDGTQNMLDRMHVKSYSQTKQGCGPARQLGQEKAIGKYILMADADCFYPPTWIQRMLDELRKDGVSCVYGRHSFIGTVKKKRWKLFLYEFMLDMVVELRHFKRPYLNALGMSMGYLRESGLKAGFVDRRIRGEDGRMCFDLMQFGKVTQVRDRSFRVWTLPRTLDKERNLLFSMLTRVLLELPRIASYFFKEVPHDTKTSKNEYRLGLPYFKKFRTSDQDDEDSSI